MVKKVNRKQQRGCLSTQHYQHSQFVKSVDGNSLAIIDEFDAAKRAPTASFHGPSAMGIPHSQ